MGQPRSQGWAGEKTDLQRNDGAALVSAVVGPAPVGAQGCLSGGPQSAFAGEAATPGHGADIGRRQEYTPFQGALGQHFALRPDPPGRSIGGQVQRERRPSRFARRVALRRLRHRRQCDHSLGLQPRSVHACRDQRRRSTARCKGFRIDRVSKPSVREGLCIPTARSKTLTRRRIGMLISA